MSDLTIRVRGAHRVRVAPERGTVHAAVVYDGPHAESVLSQVQASSAAVADTLRELEGGPVVRWSTGQVQVSAHRPWSESGTQLPLVHQARVEVLAEFGDPAELGRWLTGAVERGAAVEWVDWTLTDERRVQVEREVRQAALRDAVVRARDYADALGLAEPEVVTVADTGLLAQPQPQEMKLAAAYSDSGRPGLVIEPADLEVAAEVEAEFVVLRP